ncbi:uncharacterized protein [Cicer arietinum]|uniref:Uncharacterized protein LOC101494005 n=1 Tax=Cicer arietinum TaxID=3827 RepID=A0A1S2XJ64_CICAR|nr:uncharacterized protein LOC101494005 [Cicer arietinum]XP_004489019.1 uncharacterized protein LOC101494005 [Cicer arietinum]XP_004489020.1 uncharacterized protein LOC101494005 [Cicer arietinum]XP_027191513.1 uncharacterized protein LOC101494005 [Cicer arietinum]
MTGEEYAGPPGPKLTRLVYFVGAAVACTVAINKWREFERNSIIRQQQEVKGVAEIPSSSDSVAVHKALK